jgi:hypothetical protein
MLDMGSDELPVLEATAEPAMVEPANTSVTVVVVSTVYVTLDSISLQSAPK